MKECCGSKEVSQTITKPLNAITKGIVTTFKVKGMDCADEVSAVEKSLNVAGVFGVETNLINETVKVNHDESFTISEIKRLIEKAGLKIVEGVSESFYRAHMTRIMLISASGLFLAIGLLLDFFRPASSPLMTICYLISVLLAGVIIFPKALRSIRKFSLDMNVLMTVAVIGAMAIREFSEAASVVFLFSLAELLEAMSVTRARTAIKEVLKITPKTAMVMTEDGNTILKDVNELQLNEFLVVRPGDNIATDGTVVDGKSSVNQASLTGESKPVEKIVGDEVYAGTINETGVLKVRVTKLFSDSKISQVISMIEDAQKEKAPSQRFVDKFSSIYTPLVFILAILVVLIPPMFFNGDWNEWIYKSLVFLVIGCPCALVIATPVSVVSGLTSLARKGILVKGGVHLESLGKLKALALDKTGTITEGKPAVVSSRLLSSASLDDCIRIAASLESVSSHPLAQAMLRFAKEKSVKFDHPENFKVVSGKGAEGDLNGHSYFVGNHVFGHELGICNSEIEAYLQEIEAQAMSVIILGHKPHADCQGEIMAIFALEDKIRSNMPDVVKAFHHAGINLVAILSGDNQKTVSSVAKRVGIDEAKGALLPEDKVKEVKRLVNNYQFVGMVGDGVNDAPALANATVGIAMGVVGSDTAIETADIALMKDDISMLPNAILHGRKILSVIRFNIAFAILIKVIFFILAFLGLSNLWMAVAADMGASLFVTFNSLRLLRVSK